jgi:hypothetical protein
VRAEERGVRGRTHLEEDAAEHDHGALSGRQHCGLVCEEKTRTSFAAARVFAEDAMPPPTACTTSATRS